MLVGVWRGQEAGAEIAFVANSAAQWAYEKNTVKYSFKQPFSSGLENRVAGAVRTAGRLVEDRHGPLLSFWLGSILYTKWAAEEHHRLAIT
jgi:hypothetical protein